MKKILTVLLTVLIALTLTGCKSNHKEEDVVGGYVEAEDVELTEELIDIFNKGLEGLLGASYEPVELVATQVVAGTNYKFLANGTKTTNPVTKGTYYITIYKDLQGNIKLLDIETIEESQDN